MNPTSCAKCGAKIAPAVERYNSTALAWRPAVSAESGDVTRLLHRLAGQDDAGCKETYDRLISLVYDELRRRARQQMRNEWDWHTLQPTALVHEAYERLCMTG